MSHTTAITEQTDRRGAILEAVGFASEKFLGPDFWYENIEAVLMRFGKAAQASRAHFCRSRCEGDSKTFMEYRYGWPSLPDKETAPYRFDLKAEGLGKWMQALGRGDVVSGRPARFAKRKQQAIAQLGLAWSLMVGIVVDGNLWGMIRFDDCLAEQPWTAGETEALKMAGNIVGAAIGQHQAEEALAKERNLLRTLMETLPDPIYAKDREHRFVLANTACARVNRCQTVEELIGTTDVDRFQPDEVKAFHGDEDVVMASGQPLVSKEYLVENAPERDRWYLATKVPWRDDKGNIVGIIGSSRDITERKVVEELLQHRVELEKIITSLSTRFINLPVGGVDRGINYALEKIGKFAGVDRSYVFQFTDDSHTIYCNTHEWCAEGIEPQIQTLQEVPVDSIPWWTDKMNRLQNVYIPRVAAMGPDAAAEKKIFQSEDIQSLLGVPLVSGDGLIGFVGFDSVRQERVWQEQDVVMLKELTNIFVNALERRHAEQALRESEERHRTLFESTAEGIIITDLETKQFHYANPAACAMLGYSAKEMTTMGPADIHRQADLPHAMSEAKAMSRGEKKLATDIPFLRKDGTVIYANVSATMIVIDGRKCLAGFFTDITERKQSREKLEASLAENEILLREIHHRVKNNLQVISSLLNLHMQDVPPDQAQVLAECDRQVHAIALIHDKLHQAESVAKVGFPEYVSSLVEDTRRSFGSSAKNVTCRVEVTNVSIGIDRATPFGLILNELISNAFKHAFPGGRKGEVLVQVLLEAENMLCLSVSDNGVGFPADFDLDSSTTLGLRLVSGLVRQLKGVLEIEPGPEATVRVTFPND